MITMEDLPEIYRQRARNRIRELRESMKGNKNRPIVEGIRFRNLAEAERFCVLREAECAHLIQFLRVHWESCIREGVTVWDGGQWKQVETAMLRDSFAYMKSRGWILVEEFVKPTKKQREMLRARERQMISADTKYTQEVIL